MIHVDETSLHTKSYDGMTGVDLNRLAGDLIFRDESGNDVTQDVQGKFTVTEASFNEPGFFQAYSITGKIAIKDEYASELQLNKESFTIDGKIEKAKPVLTGLEFKPKNSFTPATRLAGTLTTTTFRAARPRSPLTTEAP